MRWILLGVLCSCGEISMAIDNQLPQGYVTIRGDAGTDVVRDTTTWESGGASVKFPGTTDGGLSGSAIFPYIESQPIPIRGIGVSTSEYELGIVFKASAATSNLVYVEVEFYSSAGASLGTTALNCTQVGATFITGGTIAQAPANSAYALLRFGKLNVADTVYVDRVYLRALPDSGVWDGTAGVIVPANALTIFRPPAGDIQSRTNLSYDGAGSILLQEPGIYTVCFQAEFLGYATGTTLGVSILPTNPSGVFPSRSQTYHTTVALTGSLQQLVDTSLTFWVRDQFATSPTTVDFYVYHDDTLNAVTFDDYSIVIAKHYRP